jgi:hypothetical protein
MAARAEHARNPTLVLPHALVRAILSRLPADERARVACVCVSWRTAVADPQLWARLDLTAESGVTCRVDSDALRAAAARARGGLVALNVKPNYTIWAALLNVAAANAASLREVRVCSPSDGALAGLNELLALVAAAPALQVLDADVYGDAAAARRLLRHEPPFEPVRLRRLIIYVDTEALEYAACAAELVTHSSLTELSVINEGLGEPFTLGQMDALVDATLALRLTALEVITAGLARGAPALARLLSSAALTELHLTDLDADPADLPLDAPAAALLSAALRANSTLRSLRLCGLGLWDDAAVATAVLGALTGHASVRSLVFMHNGPHDLEAAPAIGAALGALVAADAPALTELEISDCRLHDAGLGPLVDALPRNTHLRSLNITSNGITEAFAAERLLPAVRANTSLRQLGAIDGRFDEDSAKEEAVQLVAAREAARTTSEAAVAGSA